ncbi:universal stress protein [Natronomonas salina]|uniref:universal stress protein n=1 Tax=Natronomonas salina TaxID=1710540 RepID=UPI0015B41CFE|nr:universal stress protein [Natronomonas salina]QLD89573.1 universal stress protein [Natronomonas salina]
MPDLLVPMDGHPPAETALQYALTEFPDARITVLYVIGVVDSESEAERVSGYREDKYERERESATDVFETVEQYAADADVDVDTDIAYGPPSRTIPEYADGFDGVVMGEHGQAGARQILLGGVAETVVRRAPVPVTVVRDCSTGTGDGRFLVAVDGSPPSRRAVEHAFARHEPAEVVLLHVVDPSDAHGGGLIDDIRDAPPHGSDAWYDHVESAAERLLSECRESVASLAGEASVITDVEVGDPSRVIVERAGRDGSDHVIVGSHGRTGLDRLVLGSVAERVVRRAPVTVTVVP